MSEPVRVRDKVTGHEYSTYSPSDGEQILRDEPAVDVHGDLIPAKPAAPKTPAAPAVAKPDTTQGRKATTEEH
jgi:hypothetical protein